MEKMKKLIEQAIKFGAVGGLCFIIDWLIGLVVLNVMGLIGVNKDLATQIAAVSGFTISVIVNYILSMKFVFTSITLSQKIL